MLAIIQARSSSKRFKNKINHIVLGKRLIWYVVEGVKKSKYVKKIIVSTSTKKSDDNLVAYLKYNKIMYYRGSLNNVAERLLNTAKKFKKKGFVRICADSPLIDYKIIDKAIKTYKLNRYEIVTNTFPKTFPKGLSVEVLNTTIIEKNLKKMNKYEKEHVTKFFYNNYKNFIIKNFKSKSKKYRFNLSVDKKKDLKKIEPLLKKKFII
tara:strand:- start:794 stop:1417 length:624 start_codon:yes stop_codon:yes gene_type:complete